jgi:transposase
MELKDEYWAVVEPLIPKVRRQADGKGRPRVDELAILNGTI